MEYFGGNSQLSTLQANAYISTAGRAKNSMFWLNTNMPITKLPFIYTPAVGRIAFGLS
jgi:hypothetical protein